MAAEGNVITFIFTGEDDEVIPRNATRFIAHESLRVIPARLFYQHPNIVELICHAGVVKIEFQAFYIYVACSSLERIGGSAFNYCKSLSNINLPSAKVVEGDVFYNCDALTDVKFGKQLESIGRRVFNNCRSLERITIPLKNGLIRYDNTLRGCENLKNVDLIEGKVLDKTTAALLSEEWRDDMSAEIDSINQSLPNAPAGDGYDAGGKADAIREWISRVLHKIFHYKAEHRRLLNEAATSLMHALPNDIVVNNVVPFLELPSHTFEGEDEGDI